MAGATGKLSWSSGYSAKQSRVSNALYHAPSGGEGKRSGNKLVRTAGIPSGKPNVTNSGTRSARRSAQRILYATIEPSEWPTTIVGASVSSVDTIRWISSRMPGLVAYRNTSLGNVSIVLLFMPSPHFSNSRKVAYTHHRFRNPLGIRLQPYAAFTRSQALAE